MSPCKVEFVKLPYLKFCKVVKDLSSCYETNGQVLCESGFRRRLNKSPFLCPVPKCEEDVEENVISDEEIVLLVLLVLLFIGYFISILMSSKVKKLHIGAFHKTVGFLVRIFNCFVDHCVTNGTGDIDIDLEMGGSDEHEASGGSGSDDKEGTGRSDLKSVKEGGWRDLENSSIEESDEENEDRIVLQTAGGSGMDLVSWRNQDKISTNSSSEEEENDIEMRLENLMINV